MIICLVPWIGWTENTIRFHMVLDFLVLHTPTLGLMHDSSTEPSPCQASAQRRSKGQHSDRALDVGCGRDIAPESSSSNHLKYTIVCPSATWAFLVPHWLKVMSGKGSPLCIFVHELGLQSLVGWVTTTTREVPGWLACSGHWQSHSLAQFLTLASTTMNNRSSRSHTIFSFKARSCVAGGLLFSCWWGPGDGSERGEWQYIHPGEWSPFASNLFVTVVFETRSICCAPLLIYQQESVECYHI